MAEKKIIAIQKEELLFLRKAIIEIFAQTIDSPGDKSGYEELSKDISERLNIDAKTQRHSPGLLHKLMHDEGHNRDFLDTCYRYISDNQHDRETFLQNVGLEPPQNIDENILLESSIEPIAEVSFWQKKLSLWTIFVGVLLLSTAWLLQHYFVEKQKTIVWDMTTAWSENSVIHTAFLENFANQVKKETQGRLEIRIFTDFQTPNSNGHHLTKEQARQALSENIIQIIHSGPYHDYNDTPEALLFSTIPFGKNYKEMVAWVRQPNIKKTLENLYLDEKILTYAGGHTGPQYGGWYHEMPNDSTFFQGKTVRFAGFAGYLLHQPSVGAENKSMLQYQYSTLMENIHYDAIEWLNPEEDIKMGMHLKGFRYYDKSHWNEPNSMFLFYINQKAIENLPSDLRNNLMNVLAKLGEEKIFKDDSQNHQLAESIILKTIVPSCNCAIKIFDMQRDCPKMYHFLKRKNDEILEDFITKNPKIKELYEDYQK